MEAEERDAALRAIEFLLRVRHEMHLQRGTLHDTLEYALQLKVAEALGYADRPEPGHGGTVMRAVENFMRDYYLQARTLHALGERLTHRFRDYVEPLRHPEHARETAGGIFFIHAEFLSVSPDVVRFDSADRLFEAFVLAAENECDLDFRLRAAVERSLDRITVEQQSSPVLAAMFRRILNSGRVGATLRAMNDLNVLGAYLPEFGRLVAFFQHNVYHYFTADEHTIIAVANAEDLREREGLLPEVFRLLRRKDLLYLALLLHDIAKPDGVSEHEVTGVAVAEKVLARLGMSDIFPDVAFLIRNHLIMEQVAFRRNIHDPQTIREFAARFERPELLDYLFVLTYADLSAVNTNVWTEWKSAILQELYRRASEILRRNLRGEEIDAFHQARRESTLERLVASLLTRLPEGEVRRHVRGMQNDSYFALFSEEEIARHIAAGNLAATVDVAFTQAEGYTEITIIASDAPFALSRFCAVLAANDANIFDANIFTRDDGVIIDRFRVSDAANGRQLDQRVCAKVTEDLKKVLDGTLDVEHLFAEHRRKWKRRVRVPVNPNIRTDVVFEETERFAIIDVYAADSVGFLYRITETMSRLGLDIYFAKIATRVDGIVDAFYVRDRDGRPLKDPARRELIRGELLSSIRRMGEEQLS
jgi:[protein-PII] uridylyltransferase